MNPFGFADKAIGISEKIWGGKRVCEVEREQGEAKRNLSPGNSHSGNLNRHLREGRVKNEGRKI